MNMHKKTFYIAAFTLLGYLLQQLVHGIVEIWYIGRLTADFKHYSLGLSWSNWYVIHHILTVLLLAGGLWLGFYLGKRWWPCLYDEKGNRKPWN